MQKIVSFFLTLMTLLTSVFSVLPGERARHDGAGKAEPSDVPVVWADAYDPETFPLIGVTEKPAGAVRVMSFNIRNFDVAGVQMTDRIDLVAAQIREIAPDSFGVQEATPEWMLALALRFPDYGFVGTGRDGDCEGEFCAVFYKKSAWEVVDSGTYWLSDTPEAPSYSTDAICRRIFTYAVLRDVAAGTLYVHVNSHFDNKGVKARQEAATQIVRFIKKNFKQSAVVFTADINVREESKAYRKLTATLTDMRYAAPDSVAYGTLHATKPELRENKVIDHIMCNDKISPAVFRVVTTGIDGRFVSDHFPLYADFYIGTEE
ncbi:MAG: endonuclease/exonuclease/phosphatase family protein [Clostridia bacterium]|nr:endonuclease/exonuclease/phosphatase family protein [Clostridia bacterium]